MNHPHLKVVEGVAYCTSLELAKHFGKRHDNVLRDIETLLHLLKSEEISAEFNARNFSQIELSDSYGRTQPGYRMTRDGFALLAMGFTGAKALLWKVRYIAAFNAMEAELRRKDISERTLRKIEQLQLFSTDIRQEVRADAAAAALNIAGVFMPPIHSSKIKDLIKKGALEGRFDDESRRWYVYRDSLNAALERKRLKVA